MNCKHKDTQKEKVKKKQIAKKKKKKKKKKKTVPQLISSQPNAVTN